MRGLHAGGDGSALGVRCMEYHCYRTGGSLLDPEHRDLDPSASSKELDLEVGDLDPELRRLDPPRSETPTPRSGAPAPALQPAQDLT